MLRNRTVTLRLTIFLQNSLDLLFVSCDLCKEIRGYYQRIWENQGGTYTVGYDQLDDDVWYRYAKYWLQAQSGLCAW